MFDGTTILIRDSTRDRLKQTGRKGETYDQLINQLLDYKNLDSLGSKRKGVSL